MTDAIYASASSARPLGEKLSLIPFLIDSGHLGSVFIHPSNQTPCNLTSAQWRSGRHRFASPHAEMQSHSFFLVNCNIWNCFVVSEIGVDHFYGFVIRHHYCDMSTRISHILDHTGCFSTPPVCVVVARVHTRVRTGETRGDNLIKPITWCWTALRADRLLWTLKRCRYPKPATLRIAAGYRWMTKLKAFDWPKLIRAPPALGSLVTFSMKYRMMWRLS